jgi:hypothetical protein
MRSYLVGAPEGQLLKPPVCNPFVERFIAKCRGIKGDCIKQEAA